MSDYSYVVTGTLNQPSLSRRPALGDRDERVLGIETAYIVKFDESNSARDGASGR